MNFYVIFLCEGFEKNTILEKWLSSKEELDNFISDITKISDFEYLSVLKSYLDEQGDNIKSSFKFFGGTFFELWENYRNKDDYDELIIKVIPELFEYGYNEDVSIIYPHLINRIFGEELIKKESN